MAVVLLLSSDLERDVLSRVLELARHEVVLASTGVRAVERLREGGIDVVVADTEVAGGLSAFTAGVARLPDAPPLVLLSAASSAPADSARLGAAALVLKPFALSELAGVVSRVAGQAVPDAMDEDDPTRPTEV